MTTTVLAAVLAPLLLTTPAAADSPSESKEVVTAVRLTIEAFSCKIDKAVPLLPAAFTNAAIALGMNYDQSIDYIGGLAGRIAVAMQNDGAMVEFCADARNDYVGSGWK